MTNQSGPPSHKGPRWIVDQIAAAFEATRGPALAEPPRSRVDVDELVSLMLEEELARVEEREKDLNDLKDSKD